MKYNEYIIAFVIGIFWVGIFRLIGFIISNIKKNKIDKSKYSKKENLMDISEFRKKGYLQEVNRTFFHPLGLALQINIDDNGIETLGGIQDYRNDPEGVIYDLKNSDDERIEKFKEKAKFITLERDKRKQKRIELFGSSIFEPIPQSNKLDLNGKKIKFKKNNIIYMLDFGFYTGIPENIIFHAYEQGDNIKLKAPHYGESPYYGNGAISIKKDRNILNYISK